jgi:hypothetical protein
MAQSKRNTNDIELPRKRHSSPAREAYKARRRKDRASDPAVQQRKKDFLAGKASKSKAQETHDAIIAKVKDKDNA